MPKIAPSLLAADFSQLGTEIKKVEKDADLLHLDVMDGHFVPNITFGPPVVASVRKVTKLPLDVHLMIENPENYIEAFAKAGADIISIHAETARNLKKTLRMIRKAKVKAAVAVNPETPLRKIEGILNQVDMVLLMTVHPGFGGQKFIESVMPKLRKLAELRRKKKLKFTIEVDGGIDRKTAKLAAEAGADVLVAGTYIYKSSKYSKAIKSLRNSLK